MKERRLAPIVPRRFGSTQMRRSPPAFIPSVVACLLLAFASTTAAGQSALEILREKRIKLSGTEGVTDTYYIDSSGTLVSEHVVKPETRYNKSVTWRLKLNGQTVVAPRDRWITKVDGNRLIVGRTDSKDRSLPPFSWSETIVIDSVETCHVVGDLAQPCTVVSPPREGPR